MMRYVEFTINDVGNLVITLTEDGVVELKRLLTIYPDWQDKEIFLELLDDQLVESWYSIEPEEIRTQSKSLLLTDSIQHDKEGNITQTGNIYWFPNCEVSGYTQPLLTARQIIFQRGTPKIS